MRNLLIRSLPLLAAIAPCTNAFVSTKRSYSAVATLTTPQQDLPVNHHLGRRKPLASSRMEDFDDQAESPPSAEERNFPQSLVDQIPFIGLFQKEKKLPPMQVEDLHVLFYDIFLLINLSTSISFWVTHRLSIDYLGSAISEGCLLSIFWICAGLYHGSFLMSAVDGHYGSSDERGGPKAAAALALNTFVNAVNLRLVFALIVAIVQHRSVGSAVGEDLIPLEIGFGLVLMICWRALHSYVTPRV